MIDPEKVELSKRQQRRAIALREARQIMATTSGPFTTTSLASPQSLLVVAAFILTGEDDER